MGLIDFKFELPTTKVGYATLFAAMLVGGSVAVSVERLIPEVVRPSGPSQSAPDRETVAVVADLKRRLVEADERARRAEAQRDVEAANAPAQGSDAHGTGLCECAQALLDVDKFVLAGSTIVPARMDGPNQLHKQACLALGKILVDFGELAPYGADNPSAIDAALKKFQGSHALSSDGRVGRKTLPALLNEYLKRSD